MNIVPMKITDESVLKLFNIVFQQGLYIQMEKKIL